MSSLSSALIFQHLSSLRSNPPGSPEFVSALRSLDDTSAVLARDAASRDHVGRSSPDMWIALHDVWKYLRERNIEALLGDSTQRDWTLCIARLTRNLVAENPKNQREAFNFEPDIRAVAHAYTSHAFVMNKEELIPTRFLIQAISNIVTANEELLGQLWATYMILTEEKNILIRVIMHPDDRTAAVAFVLITNCLVRSRDRMRMLVDTFMGRRLCVAMLDRLAGYVESNDENEYSALFDVGWSLFKMLFDNSFAPPLVSFTTMEGEVVNPHQTTLLKLLDSYLMQAQLPNGSEGCDTDGLYPNCSIFSQIAQILLAKFLELIHYAQSSIRRSLGPSNTESDGAEARSQITEDGTDALFHSLDVLLPKVCEAIVLVTECFCTMTLVQDAHGGPSEAALRTRQLLSDARSKNSDGLIEDLIELLRSLDAFLPRIMFGRASWSTARPDPDLSAQIDKKDDKGFDYLKRDLVRLLGILCYENRAVQDRVRKCDGISVVMNLCLIDERNPYLREHALFILRNLLHDNVENQSVVDAIKPLGTWDENSVLRDVLGA